MARWLDRWRTRAPHGRVRSLGAVLAALALSCGGLTTGGGAGPSATEGRTGDDGGAESGIGADCTTLPCTPPLVCCPAVDQCTRATPTDCWGPVWVACTRASDCPGGEVCCVGPATLESGSFSAVCRAACVFTSTSQDPTPDQGYACNVMDDGGGLVDCPGPSQWSGCQQVPGAPASLGMCQ
jgi:hypothetical protein